MKKWIVGILAVLMVFSMTACSGESANEGSYVVGIVQYMPHNSLDQASQGFMDALKAELGEENVEFKYQDAAGEVANCNTIVDGFIAENVDLIMANATPALTAAVSATADIAILGTSITDYASALGITDWTGTVGGNVSGTSDLAPLEDQAAIIQELFPDAEVVGLLYCSGEPNSIYQISVVKACLEEMGYTCEEYAFNDANDLATVTQAACDSIDVMYMPTDNVAANYPETIGNVLLPADIPLITGESSSCAVCGVATLCIDYYDLGWITGEMAAKVLTGEADISRMPIQTVTEVTKVYNPKVCESLGVAIPEGYDPLS